MASEFNNAARYTVEQWMIANIELAQDSAGEFSPTQLGKAADAEFFISDQPDFVIPEWVWEMAVDVITQYEKDEKDEQDT